ncbi:MAG: hypothetical protein ACRC3B_02380 [Bacteroidia bacterium]
MGQRIAFYQIVAKETSIQKLVGENYNGFCLWWKNEMRIFPSDFDAEDALLDEFITANEILPDDFCRSEYPVAQNLAATLIGDYLGTTAEPKAKVELTGPLISRRHYEISNLLVNETHNLEFIRLWNYLINGRKLNGESIIQSEKIFNCIGYLTPPEIQLIRNFILHYFGNTEQMVKKYDSPELINHYIFAQTETATGIVSHTRPERISIGLESVYSVLESDINHSTSDLITLIDRND